MNRTSIDSSQPVLAKIMRSRSLPSSPHPQSLTTPVVSPSLLSRRHFRLTPGKGKIRRPAANGHAWAIRMPLQPKRFEHGFQRRYLASTSISRGSLNAHRGLPPAGCATCPCDYKSPDLNQLGSCRRMDQSYFVTRAHVRRDRSRYQTYAHWHRTLWSSFGRADAVAFHRKNAVAARPLEHLLTAV